MKFRRLNVALIAASLSLSLLACSNGDPVNNTTKTTSTTTPSAGDNTSAVSSQANTAQSNNSNHANNDAEVVDLLQSNLKQSGIDANIISAQPTSMPDIYWVTAEDMPPFFADKAGKHIIQGQIVQVGDSQPVDISAQLVAQAAQSKLQAIDSKDSIIYPAKGETKGVIYVFTDPTCPYCQKLHDEMAAINAKGIEVHYLAWPRHEQAFPIMEAIWCSSDRNAAMDKAKAGQNVDAPRCDNPIQAQMSLGFSLGVRGTPAIFTQDGRQIGGYLPAAQIAQELGL